MTEPIGHNKTNPLSWLVLTLLAAWPFLSFLDHNAEDAPIYWVQITCYGLVFILFLLALVWLGRAILGHERSAQIANTLGVGAVCLFSYLLVAGPLSDLGISLGTVKIAIWLVISLALMGVSWWLSARPNTTLVLLAVAVALVALPAIRLSLSAIEGARIASGSVSSVEVRAAPTQTDQPNVYWIILDAYPRADVLEAYFGHSNNGFLAELRERRFFIADESFSNYASTGLSVSTTANLDYYLPVGTPMHARLWTARLQGFNHAIDRFLARGYRYVHAGPGGNNDKTRCGGREALCVNSKSGGPLNLNEADIGLMQLTPLYPIFRALLPDLIVFDFNNLTNMGAKLSHWPDPPAVAFIHILSPHPPRRYNADCGPVKRVGHDLLGEDAENTPAAFVNDLRCLNRDVITFIDSVLAVDRTDPIILIQGDHGFRGGNSKLPEPVVPAIDRRLIRFANLNAMRLPERCVDMTRHDMTSVNTLRAVLTCLGEDDLPQIADRLFVHGKGTTRPLKINRGIVR